MAKITPEYMEQVSKGFKKVFNGALKQNKEDYKKIATEIIANTIVVDYKWIADLPTMREWVGDRVLKELEAFDYSIKKKNWESSIKVDRDVITYDSLGVVKPKILSLVEEVERHYSRMLFALLEANSTCYDGQNFFSATHSVNGVNFSNLGSLALSEESFMSTRNEMARIVNSENEPMDVSGNLLIVPPELEATALKILKSKTKANGEDNICYNLADVYVSRRLSNKKNWYLLDTTKVIKPLILQVNKKVEFTALDKPESEANFMRREFRYGIDSEDNAGYGLWQLAYKHEVV